MNDDTSKSTGVNYARDLTIAVNVGEIVDYGSNAAIVLQQIRYHRHDSKEEWNTQSAKDLARMTGFTARQVRRALNQLVEKGVLDRTQLRASHGDSTYSYRERPGDQTVTGGCDQTVTPGGYQTVTPLSIEKEITTYGQESLIAPESVPTDNQAGKKKNGSKKPSRNANGVLSEQHRAMFEEWWAMYPMKKRKADSLKAWAAALDAGVKRADLETAVINYLTSIAQWEKQHGAEFEWYFAAPRFIDGEYMDFLDRPDPSRWSEPKKADEAYDYSDGW